MLDLQLCDAISRKLSETYKDVFTIDVKFFCNMSWKYGVLIDVIRDCEVRF